MHLVKRVLPAVSLLAAMAVGGCVYAPYPGYYPYYSAAYAPPIYGGVVVGGGGYYHRGYWR